MAERRARNTVPVPQDPPDPNSITTFPAPAPEDTTVEQSFFDYLRTQPAGMLASSTIYWYRLEPKIKNLGAVAYIDKTSAEGVDEAWLKEKHGGGKYRAWLNTPDKSKDIQRIVSIAGPAKIYPDHELVDSGGNPIPQHSPSGPAGAQPITADAIASIVTTAIQAVKEKGASADEAVAQAMGVLRKAQEGSIEILTSSLKRQAEGGTGDATTQLLRELLTEIRTQRNPGDRKLDKIVDAGLERLLNPPAPPNPLDLVKQLKELQGLEGLGSLFGFGEKGEGSWWEPIVGKLADALSETIKSNGPAMIEAYREKIRVDAFLAQQRRANPSPAAPMTTAPAAAATAVPQVQPAPAPALMPVQHLPIPGAAPGSPPPDFPGQVPAQPPAFPAPAPPASAAPSAEPTEAEVFNMIRKQITELIVTCWDEGDSGADAAITVKRAHRPLLALIRPHFKDFNQVLGLAAIDPVLAEISKDPEFPEWAKEFHQEFMSDEAAG